MNFFKVLKKTGLLWLVLAAIGVFSGCEEDKFVEVPSINSNNKDGISVVTGVKVTPSSQTAAKGGSFQFSATVEGTNSPPQTVTWSIAGDVTVYTGISTDGLLTVGADETALNFNVRATSTADKSRYGEATVTVRDGLQITINLTEDSETGRTFILPIKKEIVLSDIAPLYIDWGDNSGMETKTAAPSDYDGFSHPYTVTGKYTITLTGYCYTNTNDTTILYVGKCGFGFGEKNAAIGYNAAANRAKITKASGNITHLTGNSTALNFAYAYLFNNCVNLSDISGLVFSETGAPGTHFLFRAFYGCTLLQSLPAGFLSGVNGPQGGSFLFDAFYDCASLQSLPAGFLSGVTGTQGASFLSSAFRGCTSLQSLPTDFLSGVNGPHGTYFLYEAFYN